MAGYPQRKRERFTWADMLTWPDDERWEIIGGEAFDMSPPPLSRHQLISMRLTGALLEFFKGKRCQPYAAPFGVKLSDEDVVQPDLFVICNPKQIKHTHIEGPPTLVIEILSESSLRRDRIQKWALYERFGVREYWIVTPHPALIEVYRLRGGQYQLAGDYGKDDTLRSATFRGLSIVLAPVFDFPLEPGEELPVVRESPVSYGRRRRR